MVIIGKVADINDLNQIFEVPSGTISLTVHKDNIKTI